MGNQEEGARLKSLMERVKVRLPQLADEANETGDFSKVDQASATLEKLAGMGDRFVQTISGQQPAMAGGAGDEPPQSAPPPAVAPPQPPAPPSIGTNEEPVPEEMFGTTPDLPARQPYDVEGGLNKLILEVGRTVPPKPQGLTGIDMGIGQEKPVPPKPVTPPVEEEGTSVYPVNLKTDQPEPAPPDPAVDPLADEGQLPSPAPSATPFIDVDQVAPQVEQDFGGNPLAVMQDMNRYAEGDDVGEMEREFYRRVNLELGQRPKSFTISKLLAALTIGAGSIVGAWLTGRYSGQALVDLNDDQRDYDARKSQIGREVAGQHSGMKRAQMTQEAMEQRLLANIKSREDMAGMKNGLEMLKEGGRNVRAEDANVSREGIAGNREAGTDKRFFERENRLDTRQDKQIKASESLARLRADLSNERVQRWDDTDKQEAMRHRQVIRDMMADDEAKEMAVEALMALEKKNRVMGR